MRTFSVVRGAACLFALGLLLSACGSGQPALNSSSAFSQQTAARQNGGESLLYIGGQHAVQMYSYPDGTYQASVKTQGLVNGLCSDSNGDVFVAAAPAKSSKNDAGFIYEYAHGGNAPIATLDSPKGTIPLACSSDPTTGDLAVTIQKTKNFAPAVSIYAKATGMPTVYTSDALGANPQLGYDSNGNLLVTSGGNVGAWLASGSTSLTKVTLDQTLGGVAHVQWDGTYFALQSFDTIKHNGEKIFERVFRVQISGSSGHVASFTRFTGWPAKNAGQSWIDGTTIVGTPYNEISFWKYPQGGAAFKVAHPHSPGKAVTISDAP
jgi:hypothetical protein